MRKSAWVEVTSLSCMVRPAVANGNTPTTPSENDPAEALSPRTAVAVSTIAPVPTTRWARALVPALQPRLFGGGIVTSGVFPVADFVVDPPVHVTETLAV